LLLLAVATSIDALAVGVVLAFYRISIGGVIGLIAGVAFLMSLFGLFLGRSLGRLLGHWPSLVAMVIFMILAVKALQGGN
ncbi:MAG: manganese efflux pump, partial [Bacteriovoracaceae bacterium]|nr:manganese efflux pump [Bacteriovoracaceae bacterium]